MAIVDKYIAFVDLGMSNKKIARVEYWVTAASAVLYLSEPTQILKDATAVGQLLLSVEDLSLGTMMGKGVRLEGENDAFAFPPAEPEAYSFDKIGIFAVNSLDDVTTLSLPARNPATYTLADDGVTIIFEGESASPEVEEFVTRFEQVVRSKYGLTLTVETMKVIS